MNRLSIYWSTRLKKLGIGGAYLVVAPVNIWSYPLRCEDATWILLALRQGLCNLEPPLPISDWLLAFKTQEVLNLLIDWIWCSWLEKFRILEDGDDKLANYCLSSGLTRSSIILRGQLTGCPEKLLGLKAGLFVLSMLNRWTIADLISFELFTLFMIPIIFRARWKAVLLKWCFFYWCRRRIEQ